MLLEFIHWVVGGLLWLIAGPLDRRRIKQFFSRRGESVQAIRWAPLTTGWMSNFHDRIYSVRYDDAKGASKTADCRTSWRSGVVIMTADGEIVE